VEWILLQQNKVAQRIAQWAQLNKQAVICGHTHLPINSASSQTPYFNCGSCINPGYITGLEIQNGRIALVQWSALDGRFSRRAMRAVPLVAI
jgi:predicted phosphodiesterase